MKPCAGGESDRPPQVDKPTSKCVPQGIFTHQVNVLCLKTRRDLEIEFKTKKMAKTASSLQKLEQAYGRHAKKIYLRLQQLQAANNLSIYEQLDPLARLHQLSGDRDEQFAVDVSPNYRLIFEVANVPIPRKENDTSAIDRSQVTKITILELSEDYHG
jgi:plasmid maintenance system killer protein